MCHRVVQRGPVSVKLRKARLVAGERTTLVRRAPPRLSGIHLQVHHHVPGHSVADALGPERPAAERHHPRARVRQQPQDDLLLARAEGRLALAVEEVGDRLAQLALDLAVRVERLHSQLGREHPRGARLPGAHEAHEHERAPLGATLCRRSGLRSLA